MRKFLVFAAVVSAVLFVCAADASAQGFRRGARIRPTYDAVPAAAPTDEKISQHGPAPIDLKNNNTDGTSGSDQQPILTSTKLVKVHYCPLLKKTFSKKVKVVE